MRTRIRVTALIILITAIITSVTALQSSEKPDPKQAYTPDNLIRLHVVANSNSTNDQDLKLEVRDLIIKELSGRLQGVKTKARAMLVLSRNLSYIESLVEAKVKDSGKPYRVKAEIGRFPFPTKAYGNLVVPSGYYDALRITLGRGKGANWWCILFPPLCFVDANRSWIVEGVERGSKGRMQAIGKLSLSLSDSARENLCSLESRENQDMLAQLWRFLRSPFFRASLEVGHLVEPRLSLRYDLLRHRTLGLP